MANDGVPNIMKLVLIAGRKEKDRLLKALAENGGHFFNISYGKGSVKTGFLMDAFGLVNEENKVVISCLLSSKEADAILDMLANDFHFDKPNTGIAYTIPVEILSY